MLSETKPLSQNVPDNEEDPLIKIEMLNYKDIKALTNFLNAQGKILPRRTTNLNSKEQKRITKLIKQARIASLLPFIIGKN
jgi:small subunit ribosomal protein S18